MFSNFPAGLLRVPFSAGTGMSWRCLFSHRRGRRETQRKSVIESFTLWNSAPSAVKFNIVESGLYMRDFLNGNAHFRARDLDRFRCRQVRIFQKLTTEQLAAQKVFVRFDGGFHLL